MTTERIAVALLGQERSPHCHSMKHDAGFGLPPIAVIEIVSNKR